MSPEPQAITRPITELFGQNPGYGFAGQNVSTAIGNYTETDIDLSFSAGLLGLLDWTRTYNSRSTATGIFGTGWVTAFSASLSETAQGTVLFTDTDGRVLTFVPDPAGGYARPQDLGADLAKNIDGSFTLAFNSGQNWAFDSTGGLTGKSQEAQSVSFEYDSSGTLLQATHSSGITLTLGYDGDGRPVKAQSSDGRAVSYGYAADGALATVTNPVAGVTTFQTSGGRISQVIAADGNSVVANTYDPAGLVSAQQFPTGGNVEFGYETATGVTTVTDHVSGAVRTFQADASGRRTRVADNDGDAATFGYDSNGYLASATSPGGTELALTHDANGNLLSTTFGGAVTSSTYDDANRVTSNTDASGGVTRFDYATDSHMPTTITDQVGSATNFSMANGLVTSQTDADGNTTTYAYDAAGNVVSITNPSGGTTHFTYDAAGNRTQVITPTGATTTYVYDAARRVTSHSNPAGEVTQYSYTATGQPAQVIDPAGGTRTMAYDALGNVTSVTDPLKRVTQFSYDSNGNLLTITDPTGATSRYVYDHLARVTSLTNPVGAVTSYEYNADSDKISTTTPSGTTTTSYDTRGNPLVVTDPVGAAFHHEYDSSDRAIATTDPAGGIWRRTYDAAGNVVIETNPAGAVTSQQWTPAGKLAAVIDPLGRKTSYAYDPAGQVTEVTDPEGGVTAFGYDADERRTAVTTAAGLTTSYRYDQAGRLAAVVDPRGWITRYEYNKLGQQIAVISPSGAVRRYRYDAAGQLTATIDPNGSATQYGYDDAGHLIMVTDAKGSVSRFGYDAMGQVTSATDALGRTTTQAYDESGNLITITDPSGVVQQMAYDADRRLTRRASGDDVMSFGYDPAGDRTVMTDATGTTRYGYDVTGRLQTVTYPDGGVLTAGYDAGGQRVSLTYPDGLELSYGYDANRRLISLVDSRAGAAVFAVDRDGRLLTEQFPGRRERRYHYDRGLLDRFLVFRDDQPVSVTSFGHDPDGRIISQDRDGRYCEFRYDPAGQLVYAGSGSGGPGHRDEVSFRYDVVGNRTGLRRGEAEDRYEYDEADQLVSAETDGRHVEFRYDSSGRLTGETAGGQHRTIEYDGFGLPVRVTCSDPEQTETGRATFNGDNLLAALVLTTRRPRDEERSASVRYTWSADSIPQILAQRVEPELDDAEHDRRARLSADFSYGYSRIFADGEHGSATFHEDGLGSTLITEDTRAWAQAAGYDAFGSPEEVPDARRGGQPELPRFGYRGELALGQLIYLRARVYDSGLGRFTTRDPLAVPVVPGQAVNPYAYASNDPLNVTDPRGEWPDIPFVSSLVHHAERGLDVARHDIARSADAARHDIAHGLDSIHVPGTALGLNILGHDFVRGLDVARHDTANGYDAARHEIARGVDVALHDGAHAYDVLRHFTASAADVAGVNAVWDWVKRNNKYLGKWSDILGDVSAALAFAGIAIAPIPGLDFLSPILEGGAALTAGLAFETGLAAKLAGDKDVSDVDLAMDAFAVATFGVGSAAEGFIDSLRETRSALKEAGDFEKAAAKLSGPMRNARMLSDIEWWVDKGGAAAALGYGAITRHLRELDPWAAPSGASAQLSRGPGGARVPLASTTILTPVQVQPALPAMAAVTGQQ